ncbi:hypothetical protein GCM10020370_66250 [Paenibacillus hodogayensis]
MRRRVFPQAQNRFKVTGRASGTTSSPQIERGLGRPRALIGECFGTKKTIELLFLEMYNDAYVSCGTASGGDGGEAKFE